MPSLFDMLANAQNGQGIDTLSRQFGLSQQQTQAAVEALLPAFSQGLKRNASDPYGIGAFMTALASGQHGQYFDNASQAFSPSGVQSGNDMLGQLFGSKDLSRAVAAQASQATGIGQDILKQMLPVIASMIMGAMFKQSTNQFQQAQAGGFGASNPLGEIIEQMMRQGGGGGPGGATAQQQQPQQGAPDPLDNPFGKVLKDMFGGGTPQQQPQTQGAPDPFDNPFGKVLKDMFGGEAAPDAPQQRMPMPGGSGMDNPFGKIFEEMLGGGQRTAEPEPQQQAPQPRTNPSGRQRNPYDDVFGDMFETGSKTRDDYQKGVEDIFDQFRKGMDRHR